jgi:hypothetical protein
MQTIKKIVGIVLLLIALVIASLLIHRPRVQPPAAAAPKHGPGMTVEEATLRTQTMAGERMSDPAYRAQLQSVVERRRVMATEATALEAEIEAWQLAKIAADPEFAATVGKLTALRQQGGGDEASLAAIEAQTKAIQALMAQDAEGQALVAKQNELDARREALAREAEETVAVRLRRQVETSLSAPVDAAGRGESK